MINSSSNPFSLSRQNERPLILDGAMGSLLQQSGVPSDERLWTTMANVEYQDIVLSVHKSYISAGANIITTNTFRTNPAALTGLSNNIQEELLRSAVNLAKDARKSLPVLIAGSNAPAEDCYQRERKISSKELEINHYNHIEKLMINGVDFILNETQSHSDEIEIICNYCSGNSIPFVLSFYLDKDLKLLSGESLEEMLPKVLEHDPLAIGINCISPSVYNSFKKNFGYNWGYYLNCGSGNPEDQIIKCGFSPGEYSEIVRDSLELAPSFIGACCGSGPEHIRKIKEVLDGNN